MPTPYDETPQEAGEPAHLKQCVYCAGITAVPQYEERGICDFCGEALPWSQIELQ